MRRKSFNYPIWQVVTKYSGSLRQIRLYNKIMDLSIIQKLYVSWNLREKEHETVSDSVSNTIIIFLGNSVKWKQMYMTILM